MRDRLYSLLAEKYNCVDRNKCLDEQVDILLANDVVVPPCKVGDVVYCVENNQIIECVVRSYSIGPRGLECLIVSQKNKYTRCSFIHSKNLKNLDRIKFTKEEAEKALKGGVE